MSWTDGRSAQEDMREEERQQWGAEVAVIVLLWGAAAWALWPVVKAWLTAR